MPAASDKTDQALLDDFVRRRDEAAFAELVRRHQAMVFAAACRICGDRAEAQDILQQALIVLARRAPQLGEMRSLGAWLHRVVLLEARKSRRKSASRRIRETMAYQMSETTTEEQGLAAKVAPELDQSLNAMGGKDREVLTLHYLEGHTFQAIAESLGGTAEAWQKRSGRALQKLAGRLRSRGVTVSTVTLGVFFTSARAEAGLAGPVLVSLTRQAFEAGPCEAAGLLGKTAVLLTMKTGIAISLASGVLLAYGWGTAMQRAPLMSSGESPLASAADDASGPASRDKRDRGFTLEMVRLAVAEHDAAANPGPLGESRLRALMFLVPRESLEDVLRILLETKDHSRFQQIAGALFGRWAEFDPAGALARVDGAGDFSYQAKRAVMVTWLNQDPEGALAVILANKSKEQRGFLSEFVAYKCERQPREAALLVDRIARDWPEVDRSLFEQVAKLWAASDALAAGDWVATYPDEEAKRNLLKTLAVDVARVRGFEGLAIADHITDPALRLQVRNAAIYWWATYTAGSSLIPGKASPARDLSGGFPPDWTGENIRTFAQAAMVNFTKNLPDLEKIAGNEEQLTWIHEGVVKGASWSDPAAVTSAAEQLPDSFAQTPQGTETLQAFIRRWHEMDSAAAEGWLSRQAPGAKTDAMRASLKWGGTRQ